MKRLEMMICYELESHGNGQCFVLRMWVCISLRDSLAPSLVERVWILLFFFSTEKTRFCVSQSVWCVFCLFVYICNTKLIYHKHINMRKCEKYEVITRFRSEIQPFEEEEEEKKSGAGWFELCFDKHLRKRTISNDFKMTIFIKEPNLLSW